MTDLSQLDAILGENIRKARMKAGITQIELSRKAGYSDCMVFRWERGKCAPTRYGIDTICKILEASAQDMIPKGCCLVGDWDNVDLKKIIELICLKTGMSISKLAEQLEITRPSICEWKKRYKPSRYATRKILDLMGVDSVPELVELLEEKEE